MKKSCKQTRPISKVFMTSSSVLAHVEIFVPRVCKGPIAQSRDSGTENFEAEVCHFEVSRPKQTSFCDQSEAFDGLWISHKQKIIGFARIASKSVTTFASLCTNNAFSQTTTLFYNIQNLWLNKKFVLWSFSPKVIKRLGQPINDDEEYNVISLYTILFFK